MDIARQKQLLFIPTEELLVSKNCMKGSFDKAQDGQTLIEVLLALGTAVVVLSATVVAVLSALNNAQFSKNQNIATQYAQEGMEVMRKMRNSNWTLFSSYSGQYCLDQNSTQLLGRNLTTQGCNGQNVGIFAREVDVEKDSLDCALPCSFRSGVQSCDNNGDSIVDDVDRSRWSACTQVAGTPPVCSLKPNCDANGDGRISIAADYSEWNACTSLSPQLGVSKVTAKVSWASNKCTNSSNLYCHSVKLVSCLGSP